MKFILLVTILFVTSCFNDYEISFTGEVSFDLDSALKESKIEGKPLLIYFNSFGCQNCRRIEEKIDACREVKKIITEKYKFVTLFTDDLSKIENKEGKRNINGKIIETNLQLNSDYQVRLTKAGSQPIFAILLDKNPTERMIGYTEDIAELIEFLK